jgi:ABC-type multidrug transport system fused ATPase/permease subunit
VPTFAEVLTRLRRLAGRRGLQGGVLLLFLTLVGAALDTIALASMVPFLTLLSQAGEPLPGRIGHAMQSVLGDTDHGTMVVRASLALFLLYVVKNTYLTLLAWLNYRIVFGIHLDLSRRLFRGYMRAPWGWMAQRNSAECIRNNTEQVRHAISEVLIPLILLGRELIVIAVIGAWLLWFQPMLTVLLVLVFGGLGGAFLLLVGRASERIGRTQVRESGNMILWLQQSFGGFKEARILGVEPFFIERFTRADRGFVEAVRFNRTVRQLPRYVLETLGIGSILLLTLTLGAGGEDTVAILPTLGVFALAALRTLPSVHHMVGQITTSLHYFASVKAVDEDLLALERLESQREPATDVPALTRAISMVDVRFRHDGATEDTLRGVTLEIPRGASVAFVGASGAGKSTIVDLLLGLHAPSSGAVRIDDVEMRGTPRAWTRQIGYVPQSIYLLDDSIRQNVAFGVPPDEIDDERVWAALQMAQLEEVVRALPAGLDTVTGEDGVRLSGGQRQRLGIARALYPDPEVLFFDEATAAVDNRTEREISGAIERLSGRKTIILVAHRLTTVRACDIIFHVESGQITASGRYDELLRDSEAFARLVQADSMEGEPSEGAADAE